ncbi:MAG: ROK family transcriptional regulator [Firmicutes bacterium]|nr:ROK family transcriptional regulator [Bacillota bacterium]MDH7494677.1 ROK family transcriptional regulator [Bacillota bacterium]
MPGQRRSLSSTRFIRSFNVVSALQTLYREGACSKSRISQITSMSPATVTRIISELVEQGVVSEYKVAESTGGRKPVIFRLNYDKLYVVGIQLVRDGVALGLCDLKGRILAKRKFRPYSLEPKSLIAELSREFELLLGMNGVNREHILGSGLAISGIVSSESGTLVRSVNLGWSDVRISEVLESALGFPVVVENDANAAALAELWFGCARDVSSFMYLKTDTGVGAGIVCGGSLMAGPRGMAGEIGHAPVVRDGRECVCGQRGCLETYMYAQGLLRRYETETGVHLEEPRDFFTLITSGDEAARRMMDEAAEALGVMASVAATMLDLDLIVVGGLWGELGERFCDPVEKRCNEIMERTGLGKTLKVRGSALGEDSDIRGAVGIVIDKWFTPRI